MMGSEPNDIPNGIQPIPNTDPNTDPNGDPDQEADALQLEFPFLGRMPERTSRDERNLMEWLVGVLAEKPPEGATSTEYRDTIQTKKASEEQPGGKKHALERVWRVQVTAGQKLPAAFERDLLVALSSLLPTNPAEPDTVYFSLYELCKIMKKPIDGKTYARIAEGLERLSATHVVAENAFYDRAGNRYRTVSTNIFQDVGIASREVDRAAKSWVTWTRVWRASVEAGYYWILDLDFFFSLRRPIERRLFQLLNGKRQYNEEGGFTIELRKWAFEHVGMSRTYTAPQIKRQLDGACETLQRRGFLSGWSYTKNTAGEWQVTYQFRRDATARVLPPAAEPPLALPSPEEAVERLRVALDSAERHTVAEREEYLLSQVTEADEEEARQRTNRFLRDSLGRSPEQVDRNSPMYQGIVRGRLLEVVKERLAGPDAAHDAEAAAKPSRRKPRKPKADGG